MKNLPGKRSAHPFFILNSTYSSFLILHSSLNLFFIKPYDRKPDYIQRPPRHPAGFLCPPRQGNGRTAGAGQCHYRGDRRTHHLRRPQPGRRARRILPALLALQRPGPLRAARLRGLAHALHLRRRTGRGVRLAPAGRQLHGHHAPRRRHRQHRPGHPRLQLHPTAHPCRRPAETHVADGHHHRGGQERLRTGQGNRAAATQGDALPEPRRASPRGHRPHLPHARTNMWISSSAK